MIIGRLLIPVVLNDEPYKRSIEQNQIEPKFDKHH